MVKYIWLLMHVAFGVGGNLFAIQAWYHAKQEAWPGLRRAAGWEFLFSLLALLSAAVYYLAYYQSGKHVVLEGGFPLAHTFFMEWKEHVFVLFFLLSLYYQLRIFLHNEVDESFWRESKIILSMLIVTGLFLSATGILVSLGFRVHS